MFEGRVCRAALGSGWSRLGLAELGLLAKLSVGGGETGGYSRGSPATNSLFCFFSHAFGLMSVRLPF